MAKDSSPVGAGSSDIPLKSFIQTAEFSDVTISPDGKYLAAIVPARGDTYKNLIAILDGKTAKVLQALH